MRAADPAADAESELKTAASSGPAQERQQSSWGAGRYHDPRDCRVGAAGGMRRLGGESRRATRHDRDPQQRHQPVDSTSAPERSARLLPLHALPGRVAVPRPREHRNNSQSHPATTGSRQLTAPDRRTCVRVPAPADEPAGAADAERHAGFRPLHALPRCAQLARSQHGQRWAGRLRSPRTGQSRYATNGHRFRQVRIPAAARSGRGRDRPVQRHWRIRLPSLWVVARRPCLAGRAPA
jgi:hypothetical protein